MNEPSEIELMHTEYGTAITMHHEIVGWINKTVDDKVIVSAGGSKKVVDTATQEGYLDHIKQMINGEHYE